MSSKSVVQECQVKVSSKSVLPERCAIVSSKGILQECHLSVSTQGVSQGGSLENVRNRYRLCSSTYVSAFGFVGFILFCSPKTKAQSKRFKRTHKKNSDHIPCAYQTPENKLKTNHIMTCHGYINQLQKKGVPAACVDPKQFLVLLKCFLFCDRFLINILRERHRLAIAVQMPDETSMFAVGRFGSL